MKITHLSILVLAFALSGCSMMGYYAQSISGQLNILQQRDSIDSLIANPDTTEDLKKRLREIKIIRKFSVEQLKLPDNGSYLYYADIGRPYVVWNVFAAPEFSLDAKNWCYFVVGCVSYRGYFDEADAKAHAEELGDENYDVSVAGIAAYSTLGWFDDPVLNTMLGWRDYHLAGLIFHELSHQVLYVKNETAFNEAFSTAVQRIAIAEWLIVKDPIEVNKYLAYLSAYKDFRQLLKETRTQLEVHYASELSVPQKRVLKASAIAQMRDNYEQLKKQWPDNISFDGWFKRPINNSRFTSTMTYLEHVPAFLTLFKEVKGDWVKFYQAVEALSQLGEEKRVAQLEQLVDAQVEIPEIVRLIESKRSE